MELKRSAHSKTPSEFEQLSHPISAKKYSRELNVVPQALSATLSKRTQLQHSHWEEKKQIASPTGQNGQWTAQVKSGKKTIFPRLSYAKNLLSHKTLATKLGFNIARRHYCITLSWSSKIFNLTLFSRLYGAFLSPSRCFNLYIKAM